jgi:hypothetical protein
MARGELDAAGAINKKMKKASYWDLFDSSA